MSSTFAMTMGAAACMCSARAHAKIQISPRALNVPRGALGREAAMVTRTFRSRDGRAAVSVTVEGIGTLTNPVRDRA